MTASIDKQIVV